MSETMSIQARESRPEATRSSRNRLEPARRRVVVSSSVTALLLLGLFLSIPFSVALAPSTANAHPLAPALLELKERGGG
jgi:hypothetical protein